jgi:hypothetical protein
MRRLLVLALAFAAAGLRADSPVLTISQELIPSPAPVGATTPVFVTGAQHLTLTWLEAADDRPARTYAAVWDEARTRWSTPTLHKPSPHAPLGEIHVPRVVFPDGSELSVFFPAKDDRILDLHTQRHRADIASAPRALSSESWSKTQHPPEPPVLSARDARVVTVWLNLAEKSPRLFAALSPTAGEPFFLPLRIDDGQPLGRASLALLRDGSAYVSWLEAHGPEKSSAALWLRRLSPDGDLSVPVLIATAPSVTAFGHPQLALAKDYDTTPAQLLIAYPLTSDGVSQLVTRLITLPPADSFARGRPCPTCPPAESTRPGHAIIGHIVRLIPEKHQVILTHQEVPGILPAGSTLFHIDDHTLRSLPSASALAARIEQRDGAWWVFEVRALVPHERP